MYDGGKVILGLAIFVLLVLFPFIYTNAAGGGAVKPDPQKPARGGDCVESTEYMKAWHMDLLNTWRDSVVRESNRVYVASDGEKHNMSLTRTCMDCHDDKSKFCDECHNYAGVSPYCWDCHNEPKKD